MLKLQQWRLEKLGTQWVFRSETGQYLGFEGEAAQGTLLKAGPNPTVWDIWHDEENPSTFRCAICVY
jgi:hypothetical protein